MKKLFGSLLGHFVPIFGQIKAARDWLTLLAVAAAAAFLYYQFSMVKRDRDNLLAFANVTCAAAGAEFDASIEQVPVGKGKAKAVKHKRGELCKTRVLHLSAFERDATKASNEALAGALGEHNRKSEADAAAAARDFAAAASAARRMEQANNDIPENDRVGRDWFDALNGLAGLQPARR